MASKWMPAVFRLTGGSRALVDSKFHINSDFYLFICRSPMFRNANDHSNEGIIHKFKPFFSVQVILIIFSDLFYCLY